MIPVVWIGNGDISVDSCFLDKSSRSEREKNI